MNLDDKPRLRPVEAVPAEINGERVIYLRDAAGLSRHTIAVPPAAFFLIAHFDGQHTIRDVQTAYVRRFGELVTSDTIIDLARQLDEALFMEGERFEAHRRKVLAEFRRATTRNAAHAGTAYPRDPAKLRERIARFFEPPEGPGEINPGAAGSHVLAIAAPHIDFQRGGPAYAHAYKALAEGCAASTFVVLGTLHQGGRGPVVVTDKDFETPLGLLPCDREFTRELIRRAGLQRTDDELAHRMEHSVEFQAVFLRYLFGTSRPIKLVPVLCGPIADAGDEQADRGASSVVRAFAGALRELLQERGRDAAVIASVDLSHVGRRFGDDLDISPEILHWVEREDRALLRHAEAMRAEQFLEHHQRTQDRTHVCGFPALYVLLSAVPATRGRLLHYSQAPDPATRSVVSFAAMAFEG